MISGTAAWLAPLTFGLLALAAGALTALLRARLRRLDAVERGSLDVGTAGTSAGPVSLGGVIEPRDGDHEGSPFVTANAARPFLLRLANGVRVLVEPGPDVEVCGPAQVVAGQAVFVRGQLDAPLSTGSWAERATLRPVLLSTRAFSDDFAHRVDHLTTCLRLLIGLGLSSLLLYATTFFSALRGAPVSIDGQPFAALALFGGVALVGLVAEAVSKAVTN